MTGQPTTFGNVIDDPLVKKMVVTIIDGLLGGAPSKVILDDIRHKWDVEIHALNDLIDAIDKELNNMSGSDLDRNQKLSEIYSQISGSNPLGKRFKKLSTQLYKLEKEEKQSKGAEDRLIADRTVAAKNLRDTYDKYNRDLADWAIDKPQELGDEIVRRL